MGLEEVMTDVFEGPSNASSGVGEGQSQKQQMSQGCDNLNVLQFQSPIHTIDTVGTVVDSNHLSVASSIEPPKVGMVFKTWQDVEAYYKEYAQQTGFGVTRAQGVYSKGEGRDRISTTWRCECWGRPDMRAVREARKRAKAMDFSGSGGSVDGVVCADELSKCKRKSKKCECKAKLYASVNRHGEWVVKGVELEHSNHTPTPRKSNLVKEYRMKGLTKRVRRKLLHFFDEGVPVSQIYGCLGSEIRTQAKVQPTVKDMSHEVYKARQMKMVGGDSAAMMSYFKKMQLANPNFYHAKRVDELGRLKDVLWVDARSRAAYEEFGDVVCFDATYLTNEYELPFVNFVGVNHHGQSILLGCALVSNEDCDTFKWIFKEWLSCMNNRAPKAILTDQAAAMRKPLEEIMPETRHRWCIWHIMRKIPEKLGKCERYHDFKSILKAVVYESLSVEEFESRWNELIIDYKLESNDWLTGLYDERRMWIPAYMRDYFWAGMKTTQRVESINSFFDGFVNRKTKLYEFPQKYAKALEKRLRDETDADANCAKYVRRLVTGFKLEKVFQRLYTDTKFQEIQNECSRMMYCYCKEERKLNENTIEYVVEDRVWIVPEGKSEEVITDRRRNYYATFNKDTQEVTCECRKFVTHGIMCKHMMRILDQNFVVDIPEQYIVRRWRKDIIRKHTLVNVSNNDPKASAELTRYNQLVGEFETVFDEAATVSEEAVLLVANGLSQLRAAIDQLKRSQLQESAALSYPIDTVDSGSLVFETGNRIGDGEHMEALASALCPRSCDVIIKDPKLNKKPRGRPKGSRNKTLAEMGFKKPASLIKKQSKEVIIKKQSKEVTNSRNNKKKAGPNNSSSKARKVPNESKKRNQQNKTSNLTHNDAAITKGKTSRQVAKGPKLKLLHDLVPNIVDKSKRKSNGSEDPKILGRAKVQKRKS